MRKGAIVGGNNHCPLWARSRMSTRVSWWRLCTAHKVCMHALCKMQRLPRGIKTRKKCYYVYKFHSHFDALAWLFLSILLKIRIFHNISKNRNISNLGFKFWINIIFCKEVWKWRILVSTKLMHFKEKGRFIKESGIFTWPQKSKLHTCKWKLDYPPPAYAGPLLDTSKWGTKLQTASLYIPTNANLYTFHHMSLTKKTSLSNFGTITTWSR